MQKDDSRPDLSDKVSLRLVGTYPTHRQPVAAAAGDFNEDGNQDLVIANFGSNDVSILLADGKGGFSGPQNFPVGNGPRSVAVGDFNHDGHLDVAVANQWDRTVSILLGDGHGHLAFSASCQLDIRPTDIVAGDFNGSGILDLAIADSESRNITILKIGREGLSVIDRIALHGEPVGLSSADIAHEGRFYLIVATAGDDSIEIFRTNSKGRFEVAESLVPDFRPLALSIGDFRGDGAQEIAIRGVDKISTYYSSEKDFFLSLASRTTGPDGKWLFSPQSMSVDAPPMFKSRGIRFYSCRFRTRYPSC